MAFAHQKLEEAKGAVAADDTEAAVLALVELWGKLPSSRLADLVTKLSSRLKHEVLPSRVFEREDRWLELAATPDPKVVPALVSVDWPAHAPAAKLRIEKLADFPPDPRLAHALREQWLRGKYKSGPGGVFWRKAFRLLLNWKDPQTTALIEAARKAEDGNMILEPILQRRTRTPLPNEPELAADLAASLAEIESLAGIDRASSSAKASKESLLAAVYEDPTNDGPRLVLADLLLEEGDERGELIQLMNAIESGRGSKKAASRVKALLHTFEQKWLGGLKRAVFQPRFRSGFVTEVTLDDKLVPTVEEWATVETLHIGPRADEAGLEHVLSHPNLRAVSRVDNFPMTLAPHLESAPPRRFELLGLMAPLLPLPRSNLAVHELVLTRERWGQTSLSLRVALDWFDESALKTTVKRLEVEALEDDLTAAFEYLTRTPTLDTIKLQQRRHGAPLGWGLRLTRDASGAPSILEAIWHGESERRRSAILGPALRALPPEALTSVVLGGPVPTTTRIDLERDLRHHQRRLASLTLAPP